jgi:hypothetical protein
MFKLKSMQFRRTTDGFRKQLVWRYKPLVGMELHLVEHFMSLENICMEYADLCLRIEGIMIDWQYIFERSFENFPFLLQVMTSLHSKGQIRVRKAD